MAHFEKYKLRAAGHLLDHYARSEATKSRENVHAEKTPENYALSIHDKRIGKVSPDAFTDEVCAAIVDSEFTHEETTGRKVRSDAVRMASWVVTLPEDCPQEMAGKFFAQTVAFMRARYGAQAVKGGYVHMDETTPHMHVPMVPLTHEGKLKIRDLVDREDLRSFHDDWQTYLQDKGVPGTVVDVPGRPRGGYRSKLKQKDLAEYDEMAAKAAETPQETSSLQKQVETLLRQNRALEEARDALEEDRDGILDAYQEVVSERDSLRAALAARDEPTPTQRKSYAKDKRLDSMAERVREMQSKDRGYDFSLGG